MAPIVVRPHAVMRRRQTISALPALLLLLLVVRAGVCAGKPWSLDDLVDELHNPAIGLLQATPNHAQGESMDRGKFMLNPSARSPTDHALPRF